MLIITQKKVALEEIEKMAEDFDGYIKLVVDVGKKILAGGGQRHFEAEQQLLEKGSEQKDLWGGGLDLETKEIDYNSIINLRPSQNNPSRDILLQEVRQKFDSLVKNYLAEIWITKP